MNGRIVITLPTLSSGITVTMNDKQTFQMCIKQGVAEHGELIAEIGELASKEYVIEQSLDKMQAEWANKVLEMNPYKNTGKQLFLDDIFLIL